MAKVCFSGSHHFYIQEVCLELFELTKITLSKYKHMLWYFKLVNDTTPHFSEVFSHISS